MEKPFEKIIISFDEDGFNRDLAEIQSAADSFNEKIFELEKNHEINLSDKEINELILHRENPLSFIKTLYTEYPTHLMELGQNKIMEFFTNVQSDEFINHSCYNNKLKALNNKVILNPEYITTLRTKRENYLGSEKAKRAYDLHQKMFSAMVQLIDMDKSSGTSTMVMSYFDYDKDHNLKATALDYNRFNR